MSDPGSPRQANEFEQAAQRKSRGLFVEIWGFMRQNKKWWLLPIVITLILMGTLVILGSTGLAPFIYTLF